MIQDVEPKLLAQLFIGSERIKQSVREGFYSVCQMIKPFFISSPFVCQSTQLETDLKFEQKTQIIKKWKQDVQKHKL